MLTPSSTEQFRLSNIMETTEYDRLSAIKMGFIRHGKNEDNLYGVYVPRQQQLDEGWAINIWSSGSIEFDLLPDVVCVNQTKLDWIEWVDLFWDDVTILNWLELRKWNIVVVWWKPLDERYNHLKLLRMSVGTIDIVESTNIEKGEKHIHIPTVHRGRTGFEPNWDQRTTTAWWALHGDLATESLREAVEESGILWINSKGEFELCLPEIEGVGREIIEQWMNDAIEKFLSDGEKYDRLMGNGWASKWNPKELEASVYAKKVFDRNFHWNQEFQFAPWVLKTILLSIKEWKRYSYRKSRNMHLSDQLIQDVWEENFREVTVHEWGKSQSWTYWIDNDPATFHIFRIVTDIEYPEWFKPIFRFYSESGVHYQRSPRIENLTGNTDTTGLKVPSSIDMKPVPFLQEFARQVVEGRTKRRTSELI